MRPAFVVIDVVHIHAGVRVLQGESGEAGHIFGNDGIENIETDPSCAMMVPNGIVRASFAI